MGHKKFSRREFIGTASCAAVGTTTLLSSVLNLGTISAMARPSSSPLLLPNDEYRALVCILLAGGNDSFNMIVPKTTEQYNEYATTRSNLALMNGDLLDLNFTDGNGVNYGIHPSMPEIQELFNNGDAAVVANVGTMIEPTTKTQILNETANLPLGLLSHADQIRQWQTSLPQERSSKGWGGRMADILTTMNENQNVSMNISLSGNNVFQVGNDTVEYSITPNGSIGMTVVGQEDIFNQILAGGVNSLLEQQYADIFKQTYKNKLQGAQDQHVQFSEAISAVQEFQTEFAPNYVSQNMHMIAKTIAARQELGMSRQTFFITLGGWDHHDEVLDNQAALLSMLSRAMKDLHDALGELELNDCVTTFTISDFARTLTSNGNGTDHAWGGNTLVMGGNNLNGGQIYGEFPSLVLNSDLELGNGVILPTTSADEYFAELALWLGVPTGSMADVLPNLANFYDIQNGLPIGFLNL